MLYTSLVDHIQQNQEQFYKVAFSYVKSREDALDIVQEAIYKALKSYRKIKHPEYIRTWFYRILVNAAITHIRRNQKILIVEDMPDPGHEPKSYLDLYNALDYLNPDDKTIIILRYFEDLKFKDIAEITGLNLNTIKTKHKKILKILKEQLDWEVSYNGQKSI